MTNAIITNEAIAAAADACWQICPGLKARLQERSNTYVAIKRGDIMDAIAQLELGFTPDRHKRLRKLFRRELAKQVAA